jgi:TrmH family RNA methyltransferase
VVLVRPETAVNVGATARVIRNTGLAGLTLVAPAEWRTLECWRSAWKAQDVLERARAAPDLQVALAGHSYVAALSGRPGGGVVRDVRDVATEIAALSEGERAALVFGPETSGLSEDELALCGRRVLIPTHPGQPSLNLSHAVAIVAYEVYRAGRRPLAGPRRATHAEKEALVAWLREGLAAIGALPPDSATADREWHALVQRTDLTPRDVRLLRHVAVRMLAVTGRSRPRLLPPASSGAGEASDGPWTPVPGRRVAWTDEPDADKPFEDVERAADGFTLPALKWRELLFLGALKETDGAFARDASRPLPRFRDADLFPPGARFEARREGRRVRLRRL